MKRFILVAILFLAAYSAGFSQTLTSGRLTVTNNTYIYRDSLDCSGRLILRFHCTLNNAVVTDTVKVSEPTFGGVIGKYPNDSALSTFNFIAAGGYTPQTDYDVTNDTLSVLSWTAIIYCGTDSVSFSPQLYTMAWPNPCIYDTVRGRSFIDLDSDCIGAYVNAPAVSLSPIVQDTVYNGVIKSTVYNNGGNGFYYYVMQKSFRTGCRISLPPVWQFLYPNSPCIVPSYSFYNLPADTAIYPYWASVMEDVEAWLGTSGNVRPLIPFMLHPEVSNMGYVPVSGQLYLVLDSRVTYNAGQSVNPPAQVNGDTLVWNFTNVTGTTNNGWWNTFFSSVYLTPDNTVSIGDSLCFDVFTSPVANDVNPANNYKTYCVHVINSYDPNLKEVSPAGEGPTGLIPNNTELTYTVHFQNTGNASAIKVVVMDTLDNDIDTASFRLVGATHTLSPEWVGSHILKASFLNIYLPDSTTNEPKSHGSFSYRVKLKQGLQPGTQIKNTAAIYFDSNSPIFTNTTLNTIEAPTGIAAINALTAISVYPNPTTGQISVLTADAVNDATLKVFNVTGDVVSQQGHLSGNNFLVDITSQATGVYFIELNTSKGQQRVKVVKTY